MLITTAACFEGCGLCTACECSFNTSQACGCNSNSSPFSNCTTDLANETLCNMKGQLPLHRFDCRNLSTAPITNVTTLWIVSASPFSSSNCTQRSGKACTPCISTLRFEAKVQHLTPDSPPGLLRNIQDSVLVHIYNDVAVVVNITCPPANVSSDGVNSVTTSIMFSNDSTLEQGCWLVDLNSSEYGDCESVVLHNGTNSAGENMSIWLQLVCCVCAVPEKREPTASRPPGVVELGYIGGSLSILGCSLMLLTFVLFKELRTLPSKVLVNLSITILIYIMLLLIGTWNSHGGYCVTYAVFAQMFVLARFSWITIMLVEIGRTLRNALRMTPDTSEKSKLYLFAAYLLFGWGTPFVITMVTVVVNFTTDFVQYERDSSRTRSICFIDHLGSVLVAFIVPIVFSIILNGILFIFISVLIFKGWRSQSKLQKDKKVPFLRVYIAILIISISACMLAFITISMDIDWVWYPYVLLDSLQGFFVFIAFFFTKKIASLYWSGFTTMCNKFSNIFSSVKTNSGMPLGSRQRTAVTRLCNGAYHMNEKLHYQCKDNTLA